MSETTQEPPVAAPDRRVVRPGEARPLGAAWDGQGTNFSLFSEVATRVELCLFSPDGSEERISLPESTSFIWHGYVPGVGPGQRYGYRVHGPWSPADGHRCNPAKLLLDPYARAIEGSVAPEPAVLPHASGSNGDAVSDEDSAPFVPRSIVVNPAFDWGDDRPPRRALADSVIYEMHVKGFTARHPALPAELRGTYAGIAHPASIEHLTMLGVNAVELMPVHQFVHDGYLLTRGLRNYWGYNSIGFFAPHNEYASRGADGEQVSEFKAMVKTLHAAGIEVILDVVYNHTAEGNHLGPMLSMKGIDNAAYYRLVDADRQYYMDYTGTGNSLNMRHPYALQLVMDSLRYWVVEMHVDGFRFDLASTLARELYDVDRLSAFFDIIHQDPLLNQVKLIAEPWDLGEGGYQVGNFPVLWCEWNGRYRDTVRDFWRAQPGTLGDFARRLGGSSDLYQNDGRRPYASINFVTAHDGFTLNDLVSYNEKHNEANGEDNRDGESHNRSWNLGAEGPTDDPQILARRARQKRNFLATLMLSQGVPMLTAGDEIGRTQGGNNNAYCQDNETSWIDWAVADGDLRDFTQRAIALRRDHPVFRRRRWFDGGGDRTDTSDIVWFDAAGHPMDHATWDDGRTHTLGLFLNGDALNDLDPHGAVVKDDSFLLLFNAHVDAMTFTLPGEPWASGWVTVLDTNESATVELAQAFDANAVIERPGQSLIVLKKST